MKIKNLKDFSKAHTELKKKFKSSIIEKKIDPKLLTDIFGPLTASQQEAINKITNRAYHNFSCSEESAEFLQVDLFLDFVNGYIVQLKHVSTCFFDDELVDGSYEESLPLSVDGFIDIYDIEEADPKLSYLKETIRYYDMCVYYSALQDAAKELTQKN